MKRWMPNELWEHAAAEHPDDTEARRATFFDLMRKHGHIVKREPDDASANGGTSHG